MGTCGSSSKVTRRIFFLFFLLEKMTFQVDLDAAIVQLQQMIQQINRALMDAFQDQLPRGVITEQRVHQQILHACQSLYDRSEMSIS